MKAEAKALSEAACREASNLLAAVDRVQAVIEFDTSGRILRANQNFLDVMGYTEEEVRGAQHRLFCTPEYVASEEYQEFWHKLRSGVFHRGVFKRRSKEGREIWIQASYNPVLDEEGRVVKVVKFATDITEARLRAAEHSARAQAIERSQAVIEFDTEGHVRDANANFLRVVGYTLREIKGKHHKLFCEEAYSRSQAYCEFWGKLSHGEYVGGRFKRVGKFGQEIWLQATYNPLFDAEGRISGVVKFATDITSLVKREEDIQLKSAGMKETVGELLSSIQSISDKTHEARKLSDGTQQEAQQGSEALGQLSRSMDEIRKQVTDIHEIVSVIGDIAGQTNLLAFNAAIEAARAGEHGVGFSVVAEEVRRLAEKSAQATQQITRLIDSSMQSVQGGREVSKRAVESFERIRAGVQQTTASVAGIDQSTEKQTRSTRHVAELIDELVEHTQEGVPGPSR